jgi:hypothetical protein
MPQQTPFPLADTVERYLAIRGDDSRLRLAVTALCDHLGLRAVDAAEPPPDLRPPRHDRHRPGRHLHQEGHQRPRPVQDGTVQAGRIGGWE